MSKGDELWGIRANVLKRLYDEGAVWPETGIRGDTFFGEIVEKARGSERGVTKRDVHSLLQLMRADDLIGGDWQRSDDRVWLTPEGFGEAHRMLSEAEGEGKDYY